jgi:hypothetical protein
MSILFIDYDYIHNRELLRAWQAGKSVTLLRLMETTICLESGKSLCYNREVASAC